jgi:hypothetical protein
MFNYFFRHSDQRFAEAGEDAEKYQALLTVLRKRRSRETWAFVGMGVVTTLLLAWAGKYFLETAVAMNEAGIGRHLDVFYERMMMVLVRLMVVVLFFVWSLILGVRVGQWDCQIKALVAIKPGKGPMGPGPADLR